VAGVGGFVEEELGGVAAEQMAGLAGGGKGTVTAGPNSMSS
jgi:hypothetical protein